MYKKAVHKSMYKSTMDRNAEFKTHKQAQKGNYTTKEKKTKNMLPKFIWSDGI